MINERSSVLLGLGCPDCGGSCGQPQLFGLGKNDTFESLRDYLLYTKVPTTFYSKPPGDWFPIVNNEKTFPAGTFIGGVTAYKVTDDGLWMEANVVSPGWFRYEPNNFSLRKRDTNVELSNEQKVDIVKEVIRTTPGGNITVAVGETAKAATEVVEFAAGFLKYLPWLALAGGAVYAYSVLSSTKVGARVLKPKKPKLGEIKKAKPVIHI